VPLPNEGDWVVRAVPEAFPVWGVAPPLTDGVLLVAPDPDPPLTEPEALPPADGAVLLPAEPEMLPLADGVPLLPVDPEVLPLADGALLVPAEPDALPPADGMLLPPADPEVLPLADGVLLVPAEPDGAPADGAGADVWALVPGVTDDAGGQS
jgi:hypothetical protein